MTMFMARCVGNALGRSLRIKTFPNISWCRYASSKKRQNNRFTIPPNEATSTASQSLIMEEILSQRTSKPSTSDELTSLDNKLAELNKLIEQREKAYASYMDELERLDEDSFRDEVEPEEEDGKYVEAISLREGTKMELSRSKVGAMWISGTPDPTVPISDIPCPGCGAMLQCQKSRKPGFIASEIFTTHSPKSLRERLCQRCETMREYNIALDASVPPEQYRAVVSTLRRRRGLVLLVLDATDFPHGSVLPELGALVGERRPVYVVVNKVDLLPADSQRYLRRVRWMIEDEIERRLTFDQCSFIRHIALVSAKTGYGIEGLVTTLIKQWAGKGDIYVVGATNAGKSSLFNQLIQSDFCKAVARDYLERATTSVWPGTTLDLLKFPVLRPTPWRIRERARRLEGMMIEAKEEEKQRLHNLSETGESAYAVISAPVGYTFLGEKEKLAKTMQPTLYGSETYSFDATTSQLKTQSDGSAEEFQKKVFRSKLKELAPNVFADSFWCYDTPGLVNPNQLINLLNQEELKALNVKNVIRPQTFILKPSQVILVSGLARLDYVEGKTSIYITTIVPHTLPVFVLDKEEADDFYREHIGTPTLGVPLREGAMLQALPSLLGREFSLIGTGWQESMADITLSSLGWVSVTAGTDLDIRLRAYTPGGIGCSVRTPALLPYAVNLRWHRKGRSAGYKVRPANVLWSEKERRLFQIQSPIQNNNNKKIRL